MPPRALGATPSRFLAQHAALYTALLGLLALGSWLIAQSRVHHRQAEAKGEYERRFRRTLEDIGLAAVTVDRGGRVTFCNHYFLRLTGWAAPDVIGSNWLERFVPETHKRRVAAVLEQLASAEDFPERYEAEVLTRDGTPRLIAWHNTRSRLGDGRILSVTAIGEDITEKRRTESELLKLHRAVEQSPSIVLITDRQGLIEYVNPKFREVTGYRPEEVIGRNPRMLKSGETSREGYAELWHTIVDGRVWHGEFHNQRKDGGLYWEAAAISAVRDASGAITHFLAVKEDITERKRLEGEVASRNRERAQTLAEMGRMATMIAHDLRNPLSSVKMTLQVLGKRATADDQARAELTRLSLDQVAYMEAILNDMLTYSRPQTPRMDWVSADKLVETALGLARRKIEDQGVRVVTRLQSGLPTLPGDVHQLRQVLSNLIVNAVQAMEDTAPAERELELATDLDLNAAGTMIRFRICDRGCGIPPGDADQLFEPFFTTRAKGTGLGLAIVRRILDQHGGRIRLLPGTPGGTCAEVLLPTVPVSAAPAAEAAASS